MQGRGQWIGPDLSTIGVKYGRDELIRSILSPSAAIGYNFRSVVVALADGRVVTGLPVEETADRLVLKTAAGERVTIPTGSIEERRTSDVSLMPDGLAQTLTESELVDLLAYPPHAPPAGRHRRPVPRPRPARRSRADRRGSTRPRRSTSTPSVDDGRGRKLSWRRVNANAEGLVDLLRAGRRRPEAGRRASISTRRWSRRSRRRPGSCSTRRPRSPPGSTASR